MLDDPFRCAAEQHVFESGVALSGKDDQIRSLFLGPFGYLEMS